MKSFIAVDEKSHFPIQNLPYGIFSKQDDPHLRVGVAIGDYVLDLSILEDKGFYKDALDQNTRVFNRSTLNPLMELGRDVWRKVRKITQQLLSADESQLRDNMELRKQVLVPMESVKLHLPVTIGDYTDFYASKEHAMNVGTMFRGKEHALMPNWVYLPVGYHGRASSVVLSGTRIRRPWGQIKLADHPPIFAPCRQLDFELEIGFIMGTGNKQGEPIPIAEAEEHLFGAVLLNDWSARDIQSWEYQPLGPFLGKNFATSISPWVIPLEALEHFRVQGPVQDPEPLEYLQQGQPGSFHIQLEVHLRSKAMNHAKPISATNYRYLYWSIAQQIAHHTIGGCNLNPGDLLASGTISGPEKETRGSMLELTWRGDEPIHINEEETREWLEDGDELILTGWCQGEGYRVGFGEVVGIIEPALAKDEVLRKKAVTENHK
ncbi:fumarylacetoacetase [Rubeoparvulum massiliense]|uniref:fumarylacetoacetase n=1 Tax=Rubeoparvulum massiliense TaxID=1631346 RepID=UPI000A497D16|nr:fumarylacetoacetase [Rubeoparvulum massiliense]